MEEIDLFVPTAPFSVTVGSRPPIIVDTSDSDYSEVDIRPSEFEVDTNSGPPGPPGPQGPPGPAGGVAFQYSPPHHRATSTVW